mgnify:CR=1 FL=1
MAQQENHFQFSLWDSFKFCTKIYWRNTTFNSLYEIPDQTLILNWLAFLTFNSLYEILWPAAGPPHLNLFFFQFSLWDSCYNRWPSAAIKLLSILFMRFGRVEIWRCKPGLLPFNSLYEIHRNLRLALVLDGKALSILFMRFPNGSPRLGRAPWGFQFSLWDSARWCYRFRTRCNILSILFMRFLYGI